MRSGMKQMRCELTQMKRLKEGPTWGGWPTQPTLTWGGWPTQPTLPFHRTELASTFLSCKSRAMVLFATDVAARGLDFPTVDWVLQVGGRATGSGRSVLDSCG